MIYPAWQEGQRRTASEERVDISIFTFTLRLLKKKWEQTSGHQVFYTVGVDLIRARCTARGVKEHLHYCACARDKPNSDSS